MGGEVEDLFHVSCTVSCPEQVRVPDVGRRRTFYHIAHEAVDNALKHGEATTIG